MFKTLRKIWSLSDLRKRIFLTFALLIIIRMVALIPIPGISNETLKEFFSGNQVLGLLDIFSGGTLSNFSIGLMGVGPYITASIIMQLLTYIVPSLDELNKEGESGRHKINQYTRYLTVPLSIVQSFSLLALLKSQAVLPALTPLALVSILLSSTAITMIFVWIGEIISEEGIGNGMSLIITVGILASIPNQVANTTALIASEGEIDMVKVYGLIAFAVIAVFTVFFIVLMNDAIRKVPISYARRMTGKLSHSTIDTFLPVKINIAGVIPIIFALSIIVFPGLAGNYFTNARSGWLQTLGSNMVKFFDPQSLSYGIMYFLLVVLFTYFYTAIVFQPKQIAENLQKQGGFVPGIRPGIQTSNFIETIVRRITFPGSVFLGIVAILPLVIQSVTHITTLVLGGTGILIIVSVVFETANQLKSHLVTRDYEHY